MKRFHYSWIVCLSCTMLLACTMGFCNNVFSIYLPYLEAVYLTGAQASALLSIRCFFGIVGMLLVDRFYQRFSLRTGLTLACLVTALAFALYALADTVWMYDLAAAISGISYGLGTMIPVSILIRNWFLQSRSTAIGICASGSGISAVLFPPLLVRIVEAKGLAAAFAFQALIAFGVALLVLCSVRDTPTEKAMRPYGVGDDAVPPPLPANTTSVSGERNRCRHTPKTLLILAACLCTGAVSSSAPGHFSAHFANQGYAMSMVSLGVSTFGIALTIGKPLCGMQFDRIGGKWASPIFLSLALAGSVCCCFSDGENLISMFAGLIFMGTGLSIATVGIPIWAGDFSTPDTYRSVLKWFQVIYAAGGVLCSFLPGMVFDHTGSYVQAYVFMAVLLGIVMVIIVWSYSGNTDTRSDQAN